ncbi:uncharacterized protein [Oscarella lobularis]|uniref:uncharacterized protein isoform X2 n=1 Tax=Oscarella lobularis TaxID=121494 RepID=UPI0033139787
MHGLLQLLVRLFALASLSNGFTDRIVRSCSESATPLKYGIVRVADEAAGSSSERNRIWVARYSCSPGYLMKGPPTRTCLPGNKWKGEMPVCEPDLRLIWSQGSLSRCGEAALKPKLGSVFVSLSVVRVVVGGGRRPTAVRLTCWVAFYGCQRGYRLEGPTTRYCFPRGKWDGSVPVCVKEIPLQGCLNSPPKALNGGQVSVAKWSVRMWIDSPERYEVVRLWKARYSCPPGFKLSGPRVRYCLPGDNSWTGSANTKCVSDAKNCRKYGLPTNVPCTIFCPRLKLPSYGSIRYKSVFNRRTKRRTWTATYSLTQRECPAGFRPVGTRIRQCRDGYWTGEEPTCRLAIFDRPPSAPSCQFLDAQDRTCIFATSSNSDPPWQRRIRVPLLNVTVLRVLLRVDTDELPPPPPNDTTSVFTFVDPELTEEFATTQIPTTEAITTQAPTTTEAITTTAPTTEAVTTQALTTEAVTTQAPTTEAVTTRAPTTEAVTTQAPTTEAITTLAPTTEALTTQALTTEAITTPAPTTEALTTQALTTEAVTTQAPTTEAITTQAPTTEAVTTHAPTTEAITTPAPTTEALTTQALTTEPVTTVPPTTSTLHPTCYPFYSNEGKKTGRRRRTPFSRRTSELVLTIRNEGEKNAVISTVIAGPFTQAAISTKALLLPQPVLSHQTN